MLTSDANAFVTITINIPSGIKADSRCKPTSMKKYSDVVSQFFFTLSRMSILTNGVYYGDILPRYSFLSQRSPNQVLSYAFSKSTNTI